MAMYWCTHKNHSGVRKTVLHGGNQCTSDGAGEESTCILFIKTWRWISCEPAGGCIEKTEKGDLIPVNPESYEKQERGDK